jgi:hypothetical protein
VLLALGLPMLAGLACMAAMGAPLRYLAINAAALGLVLPWLLFGRMPVSVRTRRVLVLVLLALLFLPLLTGPHLNGMARWLPMGPFMLHAGALAFPALAVLAAREKDYAAPILLAALLAASFQPDAALGFAIVFAAVGLHDAMRDWQVGGVVIVGFLASIMAALRGELPAQPFAERVLVDAAMAQPLLALVLFAALAGGFVLMLKFVPLSRVARFALAGSLFGFSLMAVLSNYPSVLIGYGAAPILGYGFALGLIERADA